MSTEAKYPTAIEVSYAVVKWVAEIGDHQFAEGYHLRRDGMMWFWDQYTADPGERNEITASPLRASTTQLKGLPSALVIIAEADVLRDAWRSLCQQTARRRRTRDGCAVSGPSTTS